MDVRAITAGNGFAVRSPYNPQLVQVFREAGGRWDPEGRAWHFHPAFLPRLARHLTDPGPWPKAYANLLRREQEALEEAASKLLPEQEQDLLQARTALHRHLHDPKAPKGFLLALGTGAGKTYVYAAFLRVAEALGLEGLVVVPNTELAHQTKQVLDLFGARAELTTYAKLDPEAARGRLLVLDEAHLAKNPWGSKGSDRGRRAWRAVDRSLFTLFATATPFDKPWESEYLLGPTGFLKSAKAPSFEEFLEHFRVYTLEARWGGKEYRFLGNLEDLTRFHRLLSENGFMRKRLFTPPPGLVEHEVALLDLPREEALLLAEVRRRVKQAAALAPQEERGLVMAQRTMLSRALLERFKVRAAYDLVESLLEEGWHVALFLQYRGERELNLTTLEGLLEEFQEAEARGVKTLHRHLLPALRGLHLKLPSPLSLLEERFGHLGEALAFYTGREGEAALRRTKQAWDEGRVRLLVLTGAKGGTGLSLHDTQGRRPTAQVVLSLPWTATQLDQILGRTVRVGMASRVRILFAAAKVPFERNLARTLAASLHTLGHAVRGGVPVVPERVVQAFLHDLATVDPVGFGKLLAEEEAWETPEILGG